MPLETFVYDINLDCSSPLLSYGGSWLECYTNSSCAPPSTGDYGEGRRYAWTNGSQPVQLTVPFSGSAIYVYGTAQPGTTMYATLDDSLYYFVSPAASSSVACSVESPDVLMSFESLPGGNHTFTYAGGGPLNITDVVISVPAVSATNTTIMLWSDPSIVYTGVWTNNTDHGMQNGMASTADLGATVNLNFTGVGVIVHGSLPSGNRTYNVTLDNVAQSWDSVQQWSIAKSVLFYEGNLDPTYPHTLSITNVNGMNSITIVNEMSSTLSKSSSPYAGAVVGGVIGCVCFLILIGAGLWFLRRRRRLVERLGGQELTPLVLSGPPEHHDKPEIDDSSTHHRNRSFDTQTSQTAHADFGSDSVISLHVSPDSVISLRVPLPLQIQTVPESSVTLHPPDPSPLGIRHRAPTIQRHESDTFIAPPSDPESSEDEPHSYHWRDPTPSEVDHMLELVVARIDERRSGETHKDWPEDPEPPGYEDRRRDEDRDF